MFAPKLCCKFDVMLGKNLSSLVALDLKIIITQFMLFSVLKRKLSTTQNCTKPKKFVIWLKNVWGMTI